MVTALRRAEYLQSGTAKQAAEKTTTYWSMHPDAIVIPHQKPKPRYSAKQDVST